MTPYSHQPLSNAAPQREKQLPLTNSGHLSSNYLLNHFVFGDIKKQTDPYGVKTDALYISLSFYLLLFLCRKERFAVSFVSHYKY